jgi:hypothetical protein
MELRKKTSGWWQRPATWLAGCLALTLPACQGDGHFTLLGYTTRPNYDCGIKTVRVPIFQNLSNVRDLEFEITQAVVREIELKTPYKVVGLGAQADTELVGKIIGFNKAILNRNQLNEVREAETILTVQIVWNDLRTGEVLTRPRVPQNQQPIVPTPDCAPPPAPPVGVQAAASFIPELGESITTAKKRVADRLAIQIVSMMETPW